MNIALLLVAGSLGCKAPAPQDTAWLRAPSPVRDGIHASDTEQSLRARYGESAVTRDRVQLGEGQTAPGLVLYATDPRRRLEIQFIDTVRLTTPIRATVTEPGSLWIVYPGITIGTCLDSLERLNAGPFVLLGFDWDYAGTVMSWSDGRLAAQWPRDREGAQSVLLRLEPGITPAEVALARGLAGDREFRSTAMRKLNPHVYEISVRPR
jgi:hypothetical protein